jgi:hypothetical protein
MQCFVLTSAHNISFAVCKNSGSRGLGASRLKLLQLQSAHGRWVQRDCGCGKQITSVAMDADTGTSDDYPEIYGSIPSHIPMLQVLCP